MRGRTGDNTLDQCLPAECKFRIGCGDGRFCREYLSRHFLVLDPREAVREKVDPGPLITWLSEMISIPP